MCFNLYFETLLKHKYFRVKYSVLHKYLNIYLKTKNVNFVIQYTSC